MLHLPDFNYWMNKNHWHPYRGLNSGQYVNWSETGHAARVHTEDELLDRYMWEKGQTKKKKEQQNAGT